MNGDSWHCMGGKHQDHPPKKEMQKAKWLSEKALCIAEKRREAKGKGERVRYTHLNAEFQRIASNLQCSAFFIVQLSHPHMNTGKNIALTRWTFVGKVMFLLFNMLSRLVKIFLPRSKSLLISRLQSPSAVILKPTKVKSLTVSIVSQSRCHEVIEPDAMILVFWMLSFKPTFSLSSFTFIKRLFSSSSLSAIRVVSSAYMRLLIFLPAILIPACASSSLAFLVMCSEYKLNKQGTIYSLHVFFHYLKRVCYSTSRSNCCFLTCILMSQKAGQVVWYSHLFQNFQQFVVIHTVKYFSIVYKAEVDVWNFLAFFMIQQILAIWSLVPLSFLNLAWTSGSSLFTYCWSLTWRILSIIVLAC